MGRRVSEAAPPGGLTWRAGGRVDLELGGEGRYPNSANGGSRPPILWIA